MRCACCAGLRVPEIIDVGGTRVFALRCIHCGEIIDHVRPEPPMLPSSPPKPSPHTQLWERSVEGEPSHNGLT
jgi:hypothetical protein